MMKTVLVVLMLLQSAHGCVVTGVIQTKPQRGVSCVAIL